MRKYFIIILIAFSTFLFAEVPQQFTEIGDLILESGEIIKDCKIGYSIIGEANADSSNIIMFPTWFGGLSKHLVSLIEKHNFINRDKFMIICVDALGNGISTSPSNYASELPTFSIRDMVKTQHIMLTKHLKINHLYAIVGGSMGSFQVFQWLVDYPNFMDKAVTYVCSPQRTSSDKMWLNMEKDIITLHQQYEIPEGETQRIMNILTSFVARSQNYISRDIESSEFDEYYKKFKADISRPYGIDNRLSQINAMLQHDITKDFNNSLEETAKNIKAEMLIIVSDSDQIVNPQPAIKLAEISGSELIVISNECGHLVAGCDMENFVGYIESFLKNP